MPTLGPTPTETVTRPFERPAWTERELRALRRRLQGARTATDLFAAAVPEAVSLCGFQRGAVLGVERGLLSVDPSLMRLVDSGTRDLMAPLADRQTRLGPESSEAELIRSVEADRLPRPSRGSDLRTLMGLGEHLVVPVMPEARVIALLVLDRAEGLVTTADRSAAELFGLVLTAALEHTALRGRLQDLAREVQHLTASANALMSEATGAPITAHGTPGRVAMFVDVGGVAGGVRSDDPLSDRERQIALLMASGRSNREIGLELFMSTDTVKDHVGRIVRKLGASNRVEAAARFVAMHHELG